MMFLVGFLILNVMIGGFSYYMLGMTLYFGINVLISLIVSLYLSFRLERYTNLLHKKRLMYNFIEYFVLNFDIQKTIEATLVIVLPLLVHKKQKMMLNKKKQEGTLFLESLRSYFAHQYYESFYDSINLVIERGGELMKVSEVLLYSIANSEAQIMKINRIDNNYLFNFIFHWLFIFIVGVIFRYSLNDIVNVVELPLTYIIGIEVFVATFFISLVLVIENRLRRINYVS